MTNEAFQYFRFETVVEDFEKTCDHLPLNLKS